VKPKRYIVWSKERVDLGNPFQKKWYVQQVLAHGRAEDVASLDWNEVESLLPGMQLPPRVRRLWEDYFAFGG